MKLLIVESPSKCPKISGFLGKDYRVLASVGHIGEIPPRGLNIDIEGGFIPVFEIKKDKKDVVKKIKEMAEEAEVIYLATDPDREGERISSTIYDQLSKSCQKKCKRITFTEITKAAIEKAIENPRDLDQKQIDAQTARMVLDRLIGYKVSPVLWFSLCKGTSAGRVQSIALKLICERHKEILAFKPQDFWYIEANLQAIDGDFWAKVVTEDKDNRYLDEKIATDDLDKLKKATYIIDSIEKKTKNSNPNPPFDTTSLQTTCSSLFGWSASRTMMIAQNLYETGRISYLRTDSYNISEEAMQSVRSHIKDFFGDKYLPKTPQKYEKKSSSAAQEAHECIRPTHIEDEGDDVEESDNKKMYKLIRDRFIACQMNPMVVDTVVYNIKASSNHKLIAKGQAIKFDGWYKAYKYSTAKEEMLPDAVEKETLKLNDIKQTKHATQPPAKYNDGSLVKKMEAEGVGRPATRASIIKALQDKGYVEKEKGKSGAFIPTALGMNISDFLVPNFKDCFMDIKYTANVENNIDEIAHGKRKYLEVISEFYDSLQKNIKEVQSKNPNKILVQTGKKCDVCKDGDVVEKVGKFGKFYACSKYPECKAIYNKNDDDTFSLKVKSEVKKTGKECPECSKHKRKGELLERINRKDNNKFFGCSNYPKCRYVEKAT